MLPSDVMGWAVVIVACASLAIFGHHPSRRVLHLICKPLTMVLIITATVTSPRPASPLFAWMLAGLLLSLLGDICLMFPGRLFAVGLGWFMLALVSYALGLASQVDWTGGLGLALLPLPVAALTLRWLWPFLGRLRPAVILYVLVMSTFAGLALARAVAPTVDTWSKIAGVMGAVLFMLSDTLVARRHFAEPSAPYALELGTYFVAQCCLAATACTI